MRKSLWAILGLAVLLPTLAYSAGSEQTINTLPTNNSAFQTNLQNFLKREDANRYELMFEGMVLSGGTHSTVASLTAAPASMVAFPGGHYTTEVSSITYANNETTWVIAHKDLTGSLGNFARVPGTHYLIDSVSASKPALPADSVWLMEVTTTGGSVTVVTDLRTRVPYMGTYLLAELPAAGQRGRLAFVRDIGSGTLYLDNGTTWLQTISSNPMTAAGDLIVGGAGGAPARLGIGSANQVLGVVAAGGSHEYKSIVAGSGIDVAHTANTVTVTQTVFPPTGAVQPYMGDSAPAGWLLCDGTAYDPDTYPSLFDVYITNAGGWGRGAALGTFTVNTGSETITLAGHGRSNGERVHLANSGGGLPAGLAANTKYFVISVTTDTMQLSATSGGSAIDITTAGTGTHAMYHTFQVPNFKARGMVGTGANSHDFTIASVDTGTEEITLESNTALYTGDALFYDTTVGAIGGLTDATTYYVIRVSATVVKLATTEANANNGTVINLTSSGSGVQVLRQTLTTRTAGQLGGTENAVGAAAHNHTITDPGHAHTERLNTTGGSGTTMAVTSNNATVSNTNTSTTTNTTGITVDSSAGAMGNGANMSPFLAINFIVKT